MKGSHSNLIPSVSLVRLSQSSSFFFLIKVTWLVAGHDRESHRDPTSRKSWGTQSSSYTGEGWGIWALHCASDSGMKLTAEFQAPLSWEHLSGGHVNVQALNQLHTRVGLIAQCPEGGHFQFPSLGISGIRGIDGQTENHDSPHMTMSPLFSIGQVTGVPYFSKYGDCLLGFAQPKGCSWEYEVMVWGPVLTTGDQSWVGGHHGGVKYKRIPGYAPLWGLHTGQPKPTIVRYIQWNSSYSLTELGV